MGLKKGIKEKSRKATIYKSKKCLNCSHPLKLTDNYCANCSQLNSTKQLSISDFFNEFFSSLFTYDSRLRYTLKDLLFKPGIITRNYVAGQRLKYANPFRFYLSVSIIFFILQGLSFGSYKNTEDISNNLDLSIFEDEEATKPTFKETTYFNSDSLNQELDSIIGNISVPKKEENVMFYISEKELDTLTWEERFLERITTYHKFYKNTKIKNPEVALDSLNHTKNIFNKWIYTKNEAIDRISNNPKEFLNYLAGKIPFFLFFFAPIFAFFFWLLYSKKKYSYMEHLIFIFHIFSFVFLVGVITFFPDLLFGDYGILAGIIFIFIGPIYFYKALRNFYNQSRLLTLLKFTLLNIVFFIGSIFTAIFFFSAITAIY